MPFFPLYCLPFKYDKYYLPHNCPNVHFLHARSYRKKWRLLLLRYMTNPNVNDIFLNIVSKYIYILCWRGVNWSDCIIFSDLLKQELIILQQFLTVTIARVVLRNHGKVLYRFYQIIHVQECRQKMKGFLPRYFQH